MATPNNNYNSSGMLMGGRDAFTAVAAAEELPTILCCLCGLAIKPNASNMCINCLKNQVDITDGVSKQVNIFSCRGCGRYQKPPWVNAEWESSELMALCLKKIKGLNKDVKLVDARFVYTEPHSKRIKISLTVQKEVNHSILQQSFEVEFVVQNLQCRDCERSYTEHTWNAVVQVRQKVKHKRTFFYLEQLILKNNAAERATNIKEMTDGLDFFFDNRNAATSFVQFIGNILPARTQKKNARKLVSADLSSNTGNYKHSFPVELPAVSKNDLVLLPKKLATSLGGISRLVLCHKITQTVQLVDPVTLQRADLNSVAFWRYEFGPMLTSRQLVEFVVLDVEKASPSNVNPHFSGGKFQLCEVQCARADDLSSSDDIHYVMSHMGHLLKPGDSVMGYDLASANLSGTDSAVFKTKDYPPVILVRKVYGSKHRQKKRKFRLRRLDKEVADTKKSDIKQNEMDYEEFLQEVEEDPEMQGKINMYRRNALESKRASAATTTSGMDDEDDDEDAPDIDDTLLLDELTDAFGRVSTSTTTGAAAASSNSGSNAMQQ
jgi:60S ribosomal export protein NMD3